MPRFVAHIVVHIYDEGRDYVLHYYIFKGYPAYYAYSAPAAPRLYAKAALGSAEQTALYVHVLYSARAFAAENHAAVAALHKAVGYAHVFAGSFVAAGKFERARLDRYAVVAYRYMNAGDIHVLATVGVYAVGRGHRRGVEQAEVIQLYALAEIGVNVPRGGVAHGYALHKHVFAAVEEHAARAPGAAHYAVAFVPIGRECVAVYHSLSRYHHVFAVYGRNERGKAGSFFALPGAVVAALFALAAHGGEYGIFISVRFTCQAGAAFKIEQNVAAQKYRP